jgi:hypothetical protein
MDFLAGLPATLSTLTVGLLKLKQDKGTRQRLADLLGKVADCVSDIGKSIEGGVHATERCSELKAYIVHLHKLVADETDEKTANTLTFWLEHVEAVPGYAKIDIEIELLTEVKPRWTKRHRREQANAVKEIAGQIRGVGNLLNV